MTVCIQVSKLNISYSKWYSLQTDHSLAKILGIELECQPGPKNMPCQKQIVIHHNKGPSESEYRKKEKEKADQRKLFEILVREYFEMLVGEN